MQGKYVVVGNSAAALAAVDGIRKYDRTDRVLVLNAETGPAYSRVALPRYISGAVSREVLFIRRLADYGKLGVDLVEGARVVCTDAESKRLHLEDGRTIGYEKLLIATGSSCVVPPIPGLESVPRHFLWTLDDATRMKTAGEKASIALVVGGGFIGMLIAEAPSRLGVGVTVVEKEKQLLPQLLDEEGGRLFLRAVRERGISVRLGTRVEALKESDGGVKASLSGDGTMSADMVAIAVGVTPNLAAVKEGPCETEAGILVDDHLRASCEDVFAAGDVAEVEDFLSDERVVHAILPSAVEQGLVAGANMAGGNVAYTGSLSVNVVELFGVTVAHVGRFREGPGDSAEMLGSSGYARYRKVVVDRGGCLVGGIYLGDAAGVADMGVLHGMVKRLAPWREFACYRLPTVTYATNLQAAGCR